MQRHTIATIRKGDLCSCAFRGMCAIGAIMSVVVWSLNVLASGVFPELAHDGTPSGGTMCAVSLWRRACVGHWLKWELIYW
eukprot:1257129-Pyramimonas_sp.AAC.1